MRFDLNHSFKGPLLSSKFKTKIEITGELKLKFVRGRLIVLRGLYVD